MNSIQKALKAMGAEIVTQSAWRMRSGVYIDPGNPNPALFVHECKTHLLVRHFDKFIVTHNYLDQVTLTAEIGGWGRSQYIVVCGTGKDECEAYATAVLALGEDQPIPDGKEDILA